MRDGEQLTDGLFVDVFGHEGGDEADAAVLDLRGHPLPGDLVLVQVDPQLLGDVGRDEGNLSELVLQRLLQLQVVLLHLVLQVGEHGQEEVPLQKLVLILHAGALDKLPDGAEALRDPVVVLYIDEVILVLGVLVLEDLPDAAGDVEVGGGGEPAEVDLVGPEVALAEVDEELQQDELGQFLVADVVVVGVDAVVEAAALVEGRLLEVDLVEDLLDLHEEVDGVGLVGEVAVEDGLDHAVAVVAQQPVQVLQAHQEQLAVGHAHLRGLEVV